MDFKYVPLVCLLLIQGLHLTHEAIMEPSTRIVGGIDAFVLQYAFVAAINTVTPNGRYFCGGTLYGNQHIITAAQCVHDATLFSISLGSPTLDDVDENRVTVATSIYFVHPDFNPETLDNDIAIIRLRMPIEFTNYIRPLRTLKGNLTVGLNVYAMGWGQTDDTSPQLADRLKIARLVSIENEECKLTFGNQITSNMVCTVGNYNEGICHGDTGGPLIELSKSGEALLVGIASFVSFNGCESTDPNGFTRTFPYNDWIENITSIE